ncbi:MAG: hypothetical protein Q4G53_06275, partial [Clostridia bacterium]|nr:hypothetical protein [Clostridia bacterium]
AMVAGGNRLSLTGAVAETGSAEQGTASSTSHGRFINIVPNTRTNNIKLYGITANQKYYFAAAVGSAEQGMAINSIYFIFLI